MNTQKKLSDIYGDDCRGVITEYLLPDKNEIDKSFRKCMVRIKSRQLCITGLDDCTSVIVNPLNNLNLYTGRHINFSLYNILQTVS